jgi:hypothetical protein
MRRGLCLIDVGAVDVGNFAEDAGVGHQSEVVASAASNVFFRNFIEKSRKQCMSSQKSTKAFLCFQ